MQQFTGIKTIFLNQKWNKKIPNLNVFLTAIRLTFLFHRARFYLRVADVYRREGLSLLAFSNISQGDTILYGRKSLISQR